MSTWRIVLTAALLQVSAHALAQGANACGSLENHYGPYDYRVERNGHLRIVERYHFTPQVEALVRGESGYIGADLDYTLHTSPNHHRALMALVRYGERLKTTQPPAMPYSIDCYFDRAIRYQPDDTVVRELFAQYLAKSGRAKEAKEQLVVASNYAKDNAISHYNIGLIYFDLKDYDHALEQAQLAGEEGFPRPELREKLKEVGKWQDPPAAASAPAASGASAVSTVSAASAASAATATAQQ